jgi:nitroimidazol reductase NimA-like FMN-containing flavoprotein (pyridoxamine 5'-phosphate oxidase superfamily)
MRLTKKVARVVRWARVCRVATVGAAGVPHVVPVVHVLVDGKICFASEGDAKKIQNLRRRPRATVVVDVYDDDWSRLRGVMLQGTAELVTSGPRFRRLRDLLYAKYPEYPEEAALGRGDVIVEIAPRRVFSCGLE